MSEEQKPTKPYEYFDTPGGYDLDKKLWVVIKPTIFSGLAIATCDVMLYSKPKGYLRTLGRYMYITLPLIGISTAFVGVTNIAASIRKKDDYVNWAMGGFAAGGALGAWSRSVVGGVLAGGVFALCGIGKKIAVENGYRFTPAEIKQAQGGVFGPRHDFTLTKDNPGAWRPQ